MNKPQQQHIVPKCVLKNFADKNGLLYCWDSVKDTKFQAAPGSVFKERHAYTLLRERSDPFRMEIKLSELESKLAPVVKKTVRAARLREMPILSEDEEQVIRNCFVVQVRRAMQMREKIRRKVQESRNVEYGETGEVGDHQNQQFREEYVSSLFIRPEGNSYEAFFSKGMSIGVVDESSKIAFAIGDNPVVGSTPGKIDLTDPNAVIAMPIASDVVLALRGNADLRGISKIDRYVNNINHVVSWQSDIVASRSPALTSALRDRLRKARKTVARPK